MGLRTVWAAGAVGMAMASSGCGMDKADERAKQLDAIGDVVVQTTFCTSGDVDSDSHRCAPYERAHRGQALVAYRIPHGSEGPESLDSDTRTLHFTRSASYAAYMEAEHPRAGMHWVGYVSSPYSRDAGEAAAFSVTPRLTLPGAGAPYEGPYRYRVEGGYRELTSAEDDGTAPVDCVDDLRTDCVSAATVGDDSVLPTRDLGVLAGGEEAVAEAGESVTVPFDLRYAGAEVDEAQFSLAATTSLEGGAVALSQDALHPEGDSHNRLAATVSVPAGAEPGVYEVTLSATAPGGSDALIFRATGTGRAKALATPDDRTQLRTGVMRLRVVATSRQADPDPAPEPQPEPEAEPEPPSHSEPPVVQPPAASGEPEPAEPIPAARRARLGLSLSALPRRAYGGEYASYFLTALNRSALPATRLRVCETLPGRVQFVRASRRVRFSGRRLCFTRGRLAPGEAVAALVFVHVDTDARPGMARARATATAANADRARARAGLRVLRRAAAPHRAPVTG